MAMNAENIINLLKRHIIEVGRKDILRFVTFIFVFALCTMAFLPIEIPMQTAPLSIIVLVLMYQITAAAIYATYPTNRGMHYLMIPVSATEKFISNSILIYIYYNALYLGALFIGQILGIGIFNLISNYQCVYTLPNIVPGMIIIILVQEAVMMFSSIYFRKNAFIKTILATFILCIAIMIFNTIFISVFHQMNFLEAASCANISNVTIDSIPDWLGFLIITIIFIFFNFMTWLRLRETEA